MVAKRRSGQSLWRVTFLACMGVLVGTSAWAQPSSPRIKQLVADLGSGDIATREEAMRVLSADQKITLSQLESLLRSPDLSAEQRCRISQAAKDRFMNSPRPAMGVRFDMSLPDRVAIEQVYSAFPSSRFLKPGDIIISCMGENLHGRSAWIRLGAHIFSHEPGDTLSLVVRRGAAKLEFEVPLGVYKDLPQDLGNPNVRNNNQARTAPDLERMERAWELRTREYRSEPAVIIDPKVAPADWRMDPSSQSVKPSRFKLQMSGGYSPTLVAGGEPRGDELDNDQLLLLRQQNPLVFNQRVNRAWQQQQFVQQGFAGWSNDLEGVIQTTEQELSGLETRQLTLQRQIDDLKQPGAARANQMAQVEAMLQRGREDLARIKLEIEAIRAEAAEDKAGNGSKTPATPGDKSKP